MVDVTFVEKIVRPEPPPPPPPPPAPKPQAPPAAAAPVIPPHLTVRRLEKPPPPKPMVAPRRMPKEAPPEADPKEDKGVAALGDEGKQDPAGLEGGTTQGGVVGGVAGGPIELPDDAIPPRPKSSNVIPPYPQEARTDGRTGVVVLEIVILADGSVDRVRVVRGDEPFASAAVEAVKTWKYEPARFKGQAISVYRTFSVTFKLT
jgi:protein TonB